MEEVILNEKTFRELYKKFPGGTDAEFLEFIKKEGEAKGIKYAGVIVTGKLFI